MDYQLIAPIMGRLWSPLAAVTSCWQGETNAQIAVAITAASIVPDRPRVLLQIYKENYSHQLICHSQAFALNFLGREQLELIKDFGLVSGRDRDKLAGVDYQMKATGSPVLQNSAGFLDCRVVNAMDGGDMTCFLADVLDGWANPAREPLTWREARRLIPAEWNEEWNAKISREIDRSRVSMASIDYTAWAP